MGNLFDRVLAYGFLGVAIASVVMVVQMINDINAIDWVKVFGY
jgi:hypothetical protein